MMLILALALQTAAPPPPDAEVAADLRCLAIVSMTIASAASDTEAGLVASAMYFVGRIDSRSPGFDYRGELVRLIRRGTDLEADAPRCGALLQQRGAALVELGNALKAEGRK